MKVTINPNISTPLELTGWPINLEPSQVQEPERVSVEKDGISYSLLFDGGAPKLEIWELDNYGELGALKATINLPIF